MVVAASAVVTDGGGRIPLRRRFDNGLYALLGGAMDLGESLPQAAVREVREEGSSTSVFAARITGGELRITDESTALRFVPPESIGDLPMHRSQRLRLRRYLRHRSAPHAGWGYHLEPLSRPRMTGMAKREKKTVLITSCEML
ncbi:NUDIX hydrolase [Kitasatospora sp. NPDC094019]|uniref:NUDIX hydrolase n=1 Tax=Kitasatospora sp. NPDC094019 TaxID=3364091 RepID=UPI003819C1ED